MEIEPKHNPETLGKIFSVRGISTSSSWRNRPVSPSLAPYHLRTDYNLFLPNVARFLILLSVTPHLLSPGRFPLDISIYLPTCCPCGYAAECPFHRYW